MMPSPNTNSAEKTGTGSSMGAMSHGHSRRQTTGAATSGWGKFDFNSIMDSLVPKISVFVGQGDEVSAMTFASKSTKYGLKSGFWVSSKDTFNVMAEVINYQNAEKDIYVTLDYEYLPMPSRPKDYYDVGMGAINVSPCGSIALCKAEIVQTGRTDLLRTCQIRQKTEQSNMNLHRGQ
jgi:hypothetical protein